MRKPILLAIALAGLLTPAAFAAHYSDLYVIPVVARTPGVNGTNWMSDVAIQNFQTSPLEVNLVFIAGGLGMTDNITNLPSTGESFTVPAGGSLIIGDVLEEMGETAIGALLVGGNQPFAVTSRAYSMTPDGDTIGQTVVPARDFLEQAIGDTDNSMATAYLPGLISNARFRTNLGFVAGTSNFAQPLDIEIRLRNAAGASIGTMRVPVAGGSFTHYQFSSKSVSTQSFDAGSAEVRILAGDGAVIPYASVIDNGTADAVFVLGTFPPNTAIPKRGAGSPFRELMLRMTGR